MDHEIATLLLLVFVTLFNNSFFLFFKFRLLFNEDLFFPPEYIGQVTVAFKCSYYSRHMMSSNLEI